jgi:ubiquinone biosynthesis protein UbiJ
MMSFIEKKIQTLLNKIILLDPESKHRLSELDGKIVTLSLNMLQGINFQLHFNPTGVELKTSDLSKADTTITGTPLSLLHLSLSPINRKKFFAEDVTIEGNIELGQQVIALFDELDIDWEEYLSQWVGDVPSHNIGRIAKKMRKFSKKIREALCQNINEYTHEEIKLFPPAEELQNFFHDVDVLRMDTDRLEAQIQKLTKSIDINKEA